MLDFLGFSCTITSLLVALSFRHQRTQKIDLIENSNVVGVYNTNSYYPKAFFKNYGIPFQIKDRNKIQVIFPRLTKQGEVEYIYSWYDLSDVEIPEINFKPKDLKLKTLKDLAPIIKEHLQIQPQIYALEEEYRRIDKLAALVATSDIYADQVEACELSLLQIEDTLNKAEQLEKFYVRLIREILIGFQVAKYNPEAIASAKIAFDSQYRRIKEEYQNMKDVVNAYSQLLKESKSIEY